MSTSSPSRSAFCAAWLVAIAFLVAACGSDDGGDESATSAKPAGPAAVQAAKVQIASFKYVPETIRVKAGGSITWTNQDVAPHTATSDGGGAGRDGSAFNSDTLKTGHAKTVKVSEPGTYNYYCVFHRFMVGKVVVE